MFSPSRILNSSSICIWVIRAAQGSSLSSHGSCFHRHGSFGAICTTIHSPYACSANTCLKLWCLKSISPQILWGRLWFRRSLSSVNQKVCGSILSYSSLHVKVSLGKMLYSIVGDRKCWKKASDVCHVGKRVHVVVHLPSHSCFPPLKCVAVLYCHTCASAQQVLTKLALNLR